MAESASEREDRRIARAVERLAARSTPEQMAKLREFGESHRDMGLFAGWDGRPLSLLEFTALMDREHFDENCRVAETIVGTGSGEVRVSTVWIGTDMGFGGQTRQFESMIFGGDLADSMDRYGSEADARAGHARLVRAVEAATVAVSEAELIVRTAQALIGLEKMDGEDS